MLQFKAIAGNRDVTMWEVNTFPVNIGRAAGCEVRLEAPGVWDRHAAVGFDVEEGFILNGQEGAPTRVNGETVQQHRLRNGDIIEIGSVKLQCWLAEVKRRNQAWREKLVWIALALLTALQLVLIGKLL